LYAAETVGVLPHDQRIFRFDNFLLKKRSLEDGLYSKSLSDGEHQFLHSIGLCLLFKNKNTLFLLDEPETHLNPDWRAKFISTLRDCLKPGIAMNGSNMTELLITSHSPFIISDCRREQVRVFRRDEETGTVFYEEPKINTFGTSVNILTEEIFGKKESIPDLALEKINELKRRPMVTEKDIQDIKEASRELGESVEKVLLFRELILKEDELKRKKDA
jgi:restriction system-associated AAA family ATPase